MFTCEECTRLAYEEVLNGQNPDTYSVPVCSFYDQQLKTDLYHFFIDGHKLIPCQKCKEDEYEHFMQKAKDSDMTWEEALEIINVAIAEVEWEYPMDYTIAFGKAKKALGLQIAKKPENHSGRYTDNLCPLCGKRIKSGQGSSSRQRTDWCNHCGQKIDWEE